MQRCSDCSIQSHTNLFDVYFFVEWGHGFEYNRPALNDMHLSSVLTNLVTFEGRLFRSSVDSSTSWVETCGNSPNGSSAFETRRCIVCLVSFLSST